MGIFTSGTAAAVGTQVPRRAYINQPMHPTHKAFCDNSMVRPGLPHTWGAARVPLTARGRSGGGYHPLVGCYGCDALVIDMLHPLATPETDASGGGAENGKVRLPLGALGARCGASAIPQLLPQVLRELCLHQDAVPLLSTHLSATGLPPYPCA